MFCRAPPLCRTSSISRQWLARLVTRSGRVPLVVTALVLPLPIWLSSSSSPAPRPSLISSIRAIIRLWAPLSSSRLWASAPHRPTALHCRVWAHRLLISGWGRRVLAFRALRHSLQPVRRPSRLSRLARLPFTTSSFRASPIRSKSRSSSLTSRWALVLCQALPPRPIRPWAASRTSALRKTSSLLVRPSTARRSTATTSRVSRRPRSA